MMKTFRVYVVITVLVFLLLDHQVYGQRSSDTLNRLVCRITVVVEKTIFVLLYVLCCLYNFHSGFLLSFFHSTISVEADLP